MLFPFHVERFPSMKQRVGIKIRYPVSRNLGMVAKLR